MRIELIEKYFEDVTGANADDPRSPPMGYAEQKEMLKVCVVSWKTINAAYLNWV